MRPTFDEVGYPSGVLTSGGTPQEIIDTLNKEIVRIMQLPDVKERLAGFGFTAVSSTPQEFGAYIKSEAQKWTKVIREAGINET